MASPCPSTSTVIEGDTINPGLEKQLDPYLVQFDEGDPLDPQSWSVAKKWYLTRMSHMFLIASGVFSNIVEEFHMSEIAGILTLSLFVAGYCIGPILWGPLSEQYGRRPIHVWPFVAFLGFQVGAALAPNAASILVFRFLAGTFAAAPLTNTGALISDIWDAKMRGKALAIFTVAPFAGPALGPTVAGFIGATTDWRILFWVLTGFTGFCLTTIIFTVPETYSPLLLARKAQQKREETGDLGYYAPFERQEWPIRARVYHVLVRPWVIFFQEPMLVSLTLYMSFVYGCLYLLFEAYPIVFTMGHGFNAGISGLMLLPIPVGGAAAVVLYSMYYNPRYEAEAAKLAPRPVPPEFRLHMAFIAGPLFSVSFFWFGWTSFPSISYWAPLMAGLLMGFAIQLIFLGLFNYLVDAYLSVAASALASTTVIRSLFGAGFPLFAGEMYHALNPRWASTVLGLISVAMVPIPFVLHRSVARLISPIRLHRLGLGRALQHFVTFPTTQLLRRLIPSRHKMPPMTLNGVVTKAGFMNKTATVLVSRFVSHKLTGKRIVRSKKYLVHDEENKLRTDDLVVIRNCPPVSARKRFELHQLLKSPETEREIARARRLQNQTTLSEATQPSPVLEALGARQDRASL
ncbi:polyamine transporter 1 [Coprinellus micaceus]|uniref:Polyamine transporter 1 n=1 Tax=Coprinellus micaceus TaxID=71717 RepID=A0A4Y7TXX6_COPMI|nr:polyamine transporter 1 [Coprinellus micaceus]